MMSELELCGAAFGLLSVWLTVRASIWCWPTGLVSTTLFVVMFAQARLYGDAITNVMFSVVGVYGWIAWSRSDGRDGQGGIRWGGPRVRLVAAAVCVAGIPVAGWAFTRAGGFLPYWDGAIMVLSFVAQFLLTRKMVESWVLWIVVDVISIGVYTSRGLLLTAGLYAIFLGLASRGLFAWRRLTPRAVGP
jgi:nicotinamide mononucleotide transporter